MGGVARRGGVADSGEAKSKRDSERGDPPEGGWAGGRGSGWLLPAVQG